MKILITGGDSSAHALGWKLLLNSNVYNLACTPGNGATGLLGQNLHFAEAETRGIASWAWDNRQELVIISSPEAAVNSLADELGERAIATCGPLAISALAGHDTEWLSYLAAKYRIPTVMRRSFSNVKDADEFLRKYIRQVEVQIHSTERSCTLQAHDFRSMMELIAELNRFADDQTLQGVTVQQVANGRQISLLALSDGKSAIPFPFVHRYDTLYDNDEGPYAKGMGACTLPGDLITPSLAEEINAAILQPLIRAMGRENKPYKGALQLDILLHELGPRLIDMHAGWAAPETALLLPLLQSDLLDLIQATLEQRLHEYKPVWSTQVGGSVTLVAQGYPGSIVRNIVIKGLEHALPGVLLFHDATRFGPSVSTLPSPTYAPKGLFRRSPLISKNDMPFEDFTELHGAGPRLLTLAATASTHAEVFSSIYQTLARIHAPGTYYRTDIGKSYYEIT